MSPTAACSRKPANSIKRFIDSGVLELGDRLGPLLWQMNPYKKFDEADFGKFLELLPPKVGDQTLRHVVEVRHDSFKTPAFIALLRQFNVGIVYSEHETYTEIADVTSDFVYARLQKGDDTLATGYPPKELDAWAERLKVWADGGQPADLPRVDKTDAPKKPRDVFAYVIHEGKVRAPAAAMELIKRQCDENAWPEEKHREEKAGREEGVLEEEAPLHHRLPGDAAEGRAERARGAGVKLLVDVRAVAASRRPGFSKNQLAAGLKERGIGYLHLQGLGTPKEGRLAARSGDMKALERIYAKHLKMPHGQAGDERARDADRQGGTGRILCYERDHRECHRKYIAEIIEEKTAWRSRTSCAADVNGSRTPISTPPAAGRSRAPATPRQQRSTASAPALAHRRQHVVRHEQLRAVLLVQRLQAAAKFTVSPITVYSLRRDEPTLPATTLPMWMPMPSRSGQSLPAFCALHRLEDLARRGYRALAGVRILQRRAEQRQKAVAEKLVHDAAVAIDDLDQHLEGAIEPPHHLFRRALARGGGEAADIDEHHGHLVRVGGSVRVRAQQPLDHLRRDVLAEQVGDAVARGRSRNARYELPAQLCADRAGQDAAAQQHHASRDMERKSAMDRSCRRDTPESTSPSARISAPATKPVNADSQKSSRRVERMMKTK